MEVEMSEHATAKETSKGERGFMRLACAGILDWARKQGFSNNVGVRFRSWLETRLVHH